MSSLLIKTSLTMLIVDITSFTFISLNHGFICLNFTLTIYDFNETGVHFVNLFYTHLLFDFFFYEISYHLQDFTQKVMNQL